MQKTQNGSDWQVVADLHFWEFSHYKKKLFGKLKQGPTFGGRVGGLEAHDLSPQEVTLERLSGKESMLSKLSNF